MKKPKEPREIVEQAMKNAAKRRKRRSVQRVVMLTAQWERAAADYQASAKMHDRYGDERYADRVRARAEELLTCSKQVRNILRA
jgi:hypothetical protein